MVSLDPDIKRIWTFLFNTLPRIAPNMCRLLKDSDIPGLEQKSKKYELPLSCKKKRAAVMKKIATEVAGILESQRLAKKAAGGE